MLKRFFRVVLCGAILIWKINAQEVIVAREKSPSFPRKHRSLLNSLLQNPRPQRHANPSRAKRSPPPHHSRLKKCAQPACALQRD